MFYLSLMIDFQLYFIHLFHQKIFIKHLLWTRHCSRHWTDNLWAKISVTSYYIESYETDTLVGRNVQVSTISCGSAHVGETENKHNYRNLDSMLESLTEVRVLNTALLLHSPFWMDSWLYLLFQPWKLKFLVPRSQQKASENNLHSVISLPSSFCFYWVFGLWWILTFLLAQWWVKKLLIIL